MSGLGRRDFLRKTALAGGCLLAPSLTGLISCADLQEYIKGKGYGKLYPSVDFYSALLRAGVPAEMHLFRHGPHGSGLGRGDAPLDTWPTLLETWLRAQGWLGDSGRNK